MLINLKKIIFNADLDFSYETCNFLLDLLLTDSNNNTETFRKIKNHLLNKIIDKNIINENYLKKLVESVHI